MTVLLWFLTAGMAAMTGGILVADRLWPGDMLTFFQPFVALATATALLFVVMARRWFQGALLCSMLALNAAPVLVTTLPMADSAATADIRVMTANVLFNNEQPERFAKVVADLKPDLIFVQEARHKWREILRALPGYTLLEAGISPRAGNLILSRYPATATALDQLTENSFAFGNGRAIRAVVELPQSDEKLVVYAVHAPTPRSQRGWEARQRYLDTVAQMVAAEPAGTRVIMAGDWNTPPWSPLFARTLQLSGLKATERSAWPQATRLFTLPFDLVIGTPIDRVAVSDGISVADVFTGPEFGSDHVPVIVDLKLP